MNADVVASVVIPTYDRCALLGRTLDGLAAQTVGGPRFEVIVSDDGSTDGTLAMLDARAKEAPFRLRTLRRAHGGPAAARNAGAREAKAPVLAFLDSDVLPAADWLATGLAALDARPDAGAIEGRTEVGDAHLVTPFTHQTENTTGGRFPTCNLFVRRDVFERIGGFDEGFRGAFREDSDLAFRILDLGLEIPFEPRAVVSHPPLPASWLTPVHLARRYAADARLARKHPRRYRESLDAHVVGPFVVRHARQRAYLLQVASLLAGAAAAALGWVAAGVAVALLGSAPSTAIHLAPILKGGRRRALAVAYAPVVALVSLLAALAWAVTISRARVLQAGGPRD